MSEISSREPLASGTAFRLAFRNVVEQKVLFVRETKRLEIDHVEMIEGLSESHG